MYVCIYLDLAGAYLITSVFQGCICFCVKESSWGHQIMAQTTWWVVHGEQVGGLVLRWGRWQYPVLLMLAPLQVL